MAETNSVQELAAAVGQKLPASYIEFLDTLASRPTLGASCRPILEFEGREWRPYNRQELAEALDVPVPCADETARVAANLWAADAKHAGQISAELVEKGFSLDRLARGFCVGDDGNGEPVFVDAESGGVYAYYHDDMDVEQWAGSLEELIAGSRDWMPDEDDEE